jgi:hypothetical protein
MHWSVNVWKEPRTLGIEAQATSLALCPDPVLVSWYQPDQAHVARGQR